MSLACRQKDRITHDKVGLAGTQTKRQCLPGGSNTHTESNAASCEVNGCRSGLLV